MTTRIRFARAGVAAGTLALAGAFLLPGTASAAPLDNPLLQSTCSFAQVDRAAHVAAPQLAAQLDAYPAQKRQLQQAYDRPPAERLALAQRYLDQNPQAAAQLNSATGDPRYAEFERASQRIADTCHNF